MRNGIFMLLFFLCITHVQAGDITLTQVRELYKSSVTQRESCEKLIYMVETNTTKNKTIIAYSACATMMMANYVINPLSKLSYFNKGKNILENCVQTDQNNIEIRFLRFTIQTQSPSFLGYNNAIESDKTFLLNSTDKIKDLQLKQMIISFLKSSKHVSSEQKQKLKI